MFGSHGSTSPWWCRGHGGGVVLVGQGGEWCPNSCTKMYGVEPLRVAQVANRL